jgi:hypothetical protein
MFHLAENKQDTDGTKPFVFLATCQHKLGESGQVRHIPLGSALKTYADAPKTLLSYLEPVKAASSNSPLLKRLLDEKKIFKPTFFSAMDAWEFLRDTESYKSAGIGVRLAGLWNNDRPKRLKVDIGLDVTKKRGLLTSESLVRFSVGASLGDLKLTEAELAEILQTKGGLIRVKGEWVEAETDRVKALLDLGELSFLGERFDSSDPGKGNLTIAYGRDGGEEAAFPVQNFPSTEEYHRIGLDQLSADYLYLYDNGRWLVFGLYNDPDWIEMQVIIGKEQ